MEILSDNICAVRKRTVFYRLRYETIIRIYTHRFAVARREGGAFLCISKRVNSLRTVSHVFAFCIQRIN